MEKNAKIKVEDCNKDILIIGKIASPDFEDAYKEKYLVEKVSRLAFRFPIVLYFKFENQEEDAMEEW